MKHKKNNLDQGQSGFSLLLVIMILAAMLVTTLIVSSLVIEVGRSLTKVTHSEVALYAAEAGIETALYEINNYEDVDSYEIERVDGEGDLEIEGSSYEIVGGVDVELIQEEINETLGAGQSFALSYDLNTTEYDVDLKIEFTGGAYSDVRMSAVGFNVSGGVMEDLVEIAPDWVGNVATITISGENYHKIRAYNSGTGNVDFTIQQSDGAGSLEDPIIGVRIKSHGRYKSTERIVEVDHMKWHRF